MHARELACIRCSLICTRTHARAHASKHAHISLRKESPATSPAKFPRTVKLITFFFSLPRCGYKSSGGGGTNGIILVNGRRGGGDRAAAAVVGLAGMDFLSSSTSSCSVSRSFVCREGREEASKQGVHKDLMSHCFSFGQRERESRLGHIGCCCRRRPPSPPCCRPRALRSM